MEHDGCVGCKYEKESPDSKYCLGCKQNAIDKYTPMTNADHIRAMSDEELAELFMKLAWNGEVQTTPLRYLDWLQSEVKGSDV